MGHSSYIHHRPLIVSYEVTLSCNCHCRHCDLGGLRPREERIGPGDYTRLTALCRPLLVQISGGEPPLGGDIVDIVRAVKHAHEPVYLIPGANGVLLNDDIYLS